MNPLTRDQFREGVFERDEHVCVMCSDPAVDAHHILERRLWPDGGYYLDNGASLCSIHHLEAEMTSLSCDAIREAAKVKLVIPPHLYKDQPYDKWGNLILPNGTRLKGDLFHDESVQKILGEGGVLSLFTNRVKYPRTYHLPWSNQGKDDRAIKNCTQFAGKKVVVTLKMDGENTTMYDDYVHARSLSFEPHISRNWVKAIHGKISHDIPRGWRVCGENLAAEHSIYYANLQSYFMVFSVWNDKNTCLSWDDTVEWANLLGLPLVPTLYSGVYWEEEIKEAFRHFSEDHEGYVIRLADDFPYSAFRSSVAKYVRKNHVQTHGHWMRKTVKFNGLKTENR